MVIFLSVSKISNVISFCAFCKTYNNDSDNNNDNDSSNNISDNINDNNK